MGTPHERDLAAQVREICSPPQLPPYGHYMGRGRQAAAVRGSHQRLEKRRHPENAKPYGRPSRPYAATLGSKSDWTRFRGLPHLLTPKVVNSVEVRLQAQVLLREVEGANNKQRVTGEMLESVVANGMGLRPRNGLGHWDIEPRFDLDPKAPKKVREHWIKNDSVGWELKLLGENIQEMVSPDDVESRERTILTRVSADVIGYTKGMAAAEAGERLIAALGEESLVAKADRGVSDSRIAFLSIREVADPDGENKLLAGALWEEPYSPENINAEEIDWSWEKTSLVGRVDGDITWQWYRNQGHVRYAPSMPKGAYMLAIPIDSLSGAERDFLNDYVLSQTEAGQKIDAARGRLADAGFNVPDPNSKRSGNAISA